MQRPITVESTSVDCSLQNDFPYGEVHIYIRSYAQPQQTAAPGMKMSTGPRAVRGIRPASAASQPATPGTPPGSQPPTPGPPTASSDSENGKASTGLGVVEDSKKPDITSIEIHPLKSTGALSSDPSISITSINLTVRCPGSECSSSWYIPPAEERSCKNFGKQSSHEGILHQTHRSRRLMYRSRPILSGQRIRTLCRPR